MVHHRAICHCFQLASNKMCLCWRGGGGGFRETKPFLPVVGFVYSVPSYIHVLLKTKNVTTGIKLLKNFLIYGVIIDR